MIQIGQESSQLLERILEAVATGNVHLEVMERAHKKYDLKRVQLHELTPQKVRGFLEVIRQKSEKINPDVWQDNEKKTYIWTLLCYEHVTGRSIGSLTQEDFRFFSELMNGKAISILQFEAECLIKQLKAHSWTPEEDQILVKIVTRQQQIGSIKWSKTCRLLIAEISKESNKTPKQCRERWLNHLDPSKVKGKWTPSQDRLLLLHVFNHGKKWARIVEELDNQKSEHAVKNRYNSLVNKIKKIAKIRREEDAVKALLAELFTQQNIPFAETGSFDLCSKISAGKGKRGKEPEIISSRTYEKEEGDLMEKIAPTETKGGEQGSKFIQGMAIEEPDTLYGGQCFFNSTPMPSGPHNPYERMYESRIPLMPSPISISPGNFLLHSSTPLELEPYIPVSDFFTYKNFSNFVPQIIVQGFGEDHQGRQYAGSPGFNSFIMPISEQKRPKT